MHSESSNFSPLTHRGHRLSILSNFAILYYDNNMVHFQNNEKPYVCSECHRRFTQLSALNAHSSTHSQTGRKSGRSKPSLACSECNLVFRSEGVFKVHMQSEHARYSTCIGQPLTSLLLVIYIFKLYSCNLCFGCKKYILNQIINSCFHFQSITDRQKILSIVANLQKFSLSRLRPQIPLRFRAEESLFFSRERERVSVSSLQTILSLHRPAADP